MLSFIELEQLDPNEDRPRRSRLIGCCSSARTHGRYATLRRHRETAQRSWRSTRARLSWIASHPEPVLGPTRGWSQGALAMTRPSCLTLSCAHRYWRGFAAPRMGAAARIYPSVFRAPGE